jgi:heme exporter protein A
MRIVDGDAARALSSHRLMTELSLENIALERGERRIAEGISARVAGGAALLLHGPNGSGKSTLLRVLAGLLPPAEGAITWNGADVARDREAHRARLSYLGHQDALKAGLTALENLQFWARFNGAGDADAALRVFGLGRLADRPARLLSAGQKRRLALSRLALADAPLWLLDEPVTALDAEAREAFIALLDRHLAAGGLAVIATHEPLAVAARTLTLGAET